MYIHVYIHIYTYIYSEFHNSPKLVNKHEVDKIFGFLRDASEVVVREAVVAPHDVGTRFLDTLIQKRRDATQHDVHHYTDTPGGGEKKRK